ncbi:hypothetical protein ACN47A_08915 [Myxococcus fulvus]|uniref:hypothetical protein n=1 Tax=Myxococcus fulvus TaxID=33 RepID=UPI003B9C8A52
MHNPLLVSLMFLAVFLAGCGRLLGLDCVDTNCSDYPTRMAAQLDYEADPECRADLDADEDGVACEEDTDDEVHCASASGCACSGKNRDACFAEASCCLWVVGRGCGCR